MFLVSGIYFHFYALFVMFLVSDIILGHTTLAQIISPRQSFS